MTKKRMLRWRGTRLITATQQLIIPAGIAGIETVETENISKLEYMIYVVLNDIGYG